MKGKFTYTTTQTVYGSVHLIVLSDDDTYEVDTFDSIRQVKEQLIREGWENNEIFVSIEALNEVI